MQMEVFHMWRNLTTMASFPEADHFRRLGMPNTIDRLVDGSIAAHVMHHTAHLMASLTGCDVVL